MIAHFFSVDLFSPPWEENEPGCATYSMTTSIWFRICMIYVFTHDEHGVFLPSLKQQPLLSFNLSSLASIHDPQPLKNSVC
jgi:hypothetical protein